MNFNYKGISTIIQCNNNDKLKKICEKFCIKLKIDINNLIFIYSGNILSLELEFNQVVN